MNDRLSALERAPVARPLGRCEIFIRDEETYAVMVPEFMVDDLAWNVEARTTLLRIDGHRIYALDESRIAHLAGIG